MSSSTIRAQRARRILKADGGKRVEVTLTASQSLKLDLLASEAGKPRSTVIAELIEGAKPVPLLMRQRWITPEELAEEFPGPQSQAKGE